MLELKSRAELAKDAQTLARGSELVRHRNITYLPADYETPDPDVPPDPERTIWHPLNRDHIRRLATDQFNTLFANDAELRNFDFMVAQAAEQWDLNSTGLLVRTEEGLRFLDERGDLIIPTGNFVPNTLAPVLNEDKAAKDTVMATIVEWLDSEEEAHSLLRHLATSLAPHWSAVKYILLLGEGRNGKSLLMKMLAGLFGFDNVSSVSRQHIAEQRSVIIQLNGKLLNIVYDGRAEYLKDSGTEKSLIAGEPVAIEDKYVSAPVRVQTNALFIEGLQREPKSSDKSSALQKRLVRFQFPNVYALDHAFERAMLTEESLGAFLSLLIDHYVTEDSVAVMLAPTTKALELQLEHMYINSVAMQFLKHIEDVDPLGADSLLGEEMDKLVQMFQSWRLKENDLGSWSEPDVIALFTPLINTERRSVRTTEGPRKVRFTTSYKSEARAFLDTLKGENDGEIHDHSEGVEGSTED